MLFSRTRAMLDKTINDIKNIAFSFGIALQGGYIAYLIYAIIVQTGVWLLNLILLPLSIAYLVFYIYTRRKEAIDKETKKKVSKTYSLCKKIAKGFSIGVTIYGICIASGKLNPISLLFVAFSIFTLALQILLDIIVYIIHKRIDLLLAAFEADKDAMLAPITQTTQKVGNFFKGLVGQEVAPTQEPTKTEKFLNRLKEEFVQSHKEEKKAKKQAKKQEKMAKRQQKNKGR